METTQATHGSETMKRYFVKDSFQREDGSLLVRIWDGKEFLRGEGKSYRRQAEAYKAAARSIVRGQAIGSVTVEVYEV